MNERMSASSMTWMSEKEQHNKKKQYYDLWWFLSFGRNISLPNSFQRLCTMWMLNFMLSLTAVQNAALKNDIISKWIYLENRFGMAF